jgi:hydrogenase expression/formation protein HypC
MCLAVPGKLTDISNADPVMRTGHVSFGDISKEVNLACVPEAKIGDYLIVHVGFAISILDEEDAKRVLETLDQLDSAEDHLS